jgi:hypothetical protein
MIFVTSSKLAFSGKVNVDSCEGLLGAAMRVRQGLLSPCPHCEMKGEMKTEKKTEKKSL